MVIVVVIIIIIIIRICSGVVIIGYVLLPQFVVARYWRANKLNDVNERTFTTKQYKNKFTYQQVHKRKHYKYLNIAC